MIREAWRDIATGTARTGALTLGAVAIIVLAASAEVVSIHQLTEQAREFEHSGSSVSILTTEGGVDGARCDSLAQIPGVRAAGAIRATTHSIRPAVLPGAPIPVSEASPGFVAVIGAQPSGAGVLVGPEATEALGLSRSGTIPASGAQVAVAGGYEYPRDGRRPGLSYAAVAPSNTHTPFDECWVDTWPVKDMTAPLVSTVRVGAGSGAQPTLSQLNTTHGKSFAGSVLFHQRVSRFAAILVTVAGGVLGFASVRSRRLPLASALHAGVTRRALFWIVSLETLAWCLASAAFGATLTVLIAAGSGEGFPGSLGLALAAAIPLWPAAFAGAWVGLAETRESQLFGYFKTR